MAKGNLLIVDDESVLLRILAINLKAHADTIFTAENGIEAIAVLTKEEIHCVICDVKMPEMNGVELIKTIRALDNQVPFIFFTGQGDHELMLEVAKYGAFDFFNKPDFAGLEDVVIRGLQRGFSKPEDNSSEKISLSEYQKLLGDLKEV